MPRPRRLVALLLLGVLLLGGCSEDQGGAPAEGARAAERLPLLLVTLDTTRADAVAPEASAQATPHLAAVAERGLRFAQAYTTAPMTLPAHASMLTGLTPAEHGVHENGRHLAADHPSLPEALQRLGYRTAAFVSGFPLDRRFGLARGFDHYDDELPSGAGASERDAGATTDRALAWLAALPAGGASTATPFLWVHYYDPHEPYAPPEPFRSGFAASPYHGEVAFVDQQLGRLLDAMTERFGADGFRLAVAGDHGEGLGDHGEALHGNLLYNSVMRVPLLLAGPGVPAGVRAEPVSVRRLYDTLLGWAGEAAPRTLLAVVDEPVPGEAMAPYLQYGWQPQVMMVHGRWKAIRTGGPGPGLELYDVIADPAEEDDRADGAPLDRPLRQALRDYPLPSPDRVDPGDLDAEARERLASLGYLAGPSRAAPVRPDAPSPPAMTHLFADLDRASGLFERGEYAAALPVLERILAADPGNRAAALRLAVAHSVLSQDRRADAAFARAEALAPGSTDVAHYRGMHHLRRGEWGAAGALFEAVLTSEPNRLPALEALARVRERQNRPAEAAALLLRVGAGKPDPVPALLRAGELAMAAGDTATALAAYEQARELQAGAFSHHLELGVLYLAQGRLAEAGEALDHVPPAHTGYPMALFKRAQVAALAGEPDREARIRRAWQQADATTRPLIRQERLFAGTDLP
ncbi:MAG TPA: sulfatase-like hydrolase/transferase [Thermoanaerobaculia bacterium]|nr:sulfatase-like hydrolase/transferase [Thermoanaerobaculia bacterium]